jgi:hypothetical protein
VGTLVIDIADTAQVPDVEACGLRCVVTQTIMHTPEQAAALAAVAMAANAR